MRLQASFAVTLLCSSAFAQISDVTPPVLESFSFTPTSIDTRTNTQNITFTLQVSDDISGVQGMYLNMYGPNDQWRQAFPTLTSGTAMRGTYSGILNFPQFSSSGPWRIETIYLGDTAGNLAAISHQTLRDRKLPAILDVVSTPDITPPKIEELAFTPATIDTSLADAVINLRVRLTDAQTGIGIEAGQAPGCGCIVEFLAIVSPSGRQRRWIGNTEMHLVSGTRNDGFWEGSLRMPRHSEPGAWRVIFTLFDSARNRIFPTSDYLDPLGLPSKITVASNDPDLEPPTLTSLTVAPALVVSTLESQRITLTLGVRDNLAGVDFARQSVCPCKLLGLKLTSPSGAQYIDTWFSTLTQVSGGTLEGQWTTTLSLPRFAEAGTWRIEAYLRDRNYNERVMLQKDLEGKFQSGIDVFRPSYTTPDGTVDPAGGVIEDDVFGSRARLTIPSQALPARTTISLDVLHAPPNNIFIPQGFSNPGTRFVNVNLVPHPTAPIGSPGYTITIPLVEPMPPGAVLTLFRLDPILGALIPAASVNAGNVTGTVDTGGQSATFAGIAAFSTVVALLSSAQKPGDLNNDGIVSCLDVAVVRAAFGKRAGQQGFDGRADINRDGIVNVSDLSYVLRQLPQGTLCQ